MNLGQDWIEGGGLRAIAVGDRERSEAVVVLLHGFSMRPADLAPFAHSLRVPAWFLFPEGPLAAERGGRAWWTIDVAAREASIAEGPRDFAALDPDELPDARERLEAFVGALEGERRGRPVVLGGFSQGGMVALDTVLRGGLRVDAMALMSTSRVAFEEWQTRLRSGRLEGVPCMVSHGREDPDLAFTAGATLAEELERAGAAVTWLPFDGGHELPLVVWRGLRRLVGGLIAP